MKEPWECHTSADCAKLDKCKELEEGRGCSCVDSTCESQCATKVEESFRFTMPTIKLSGWESECCTGA